MTEWSLNLDLRTPKRLLSLYYWEKQTVVDRNNCSREKILRNEVKAIKQMRHEEKNLCGSQFNNSLLRNAEQMTQFL